MSALLHPRLNSSNRMDSMKLLPKQVIGSGERPSIDGETLYYADLDGIVYSLDLASGNQNWDAQPDGPVVASLLIVGGPDIRCD